MGQLPMKDVTPDAVFDNVFDNVGVNYSGPVYIKHGSMCKPARVKAYVSVSFFVFQGCFLKSLSNLTSEAFITCLRYFITLAANLP